MAYIPTEWATGDVITAEKLNKAENGIAAAGAYIVEVSEMLPAGATLYASYNDLVSHIDKEIIAQFDSLEDDHLLTRATLVSLSSGEGYTATFFTGYETIEFYAESADAETMVYEA